MSSYIVLISKDIGGAERRFFDIYRSLLELEPHTRLVLSARSLKLLKLSKMESVGLIPIGKDNDSFLVFIIKYVFWLFRNTRCTDSFHYPMNCLVFLHLLCRRKVSLSLTHCYRAPHVKYLTFSDVRQHISLFLVKRVDVLNPLVYEELQRYRFLRRSKLTLTPGGTYVKPTGYAVCEKQMRIGFMGRLVSGKRPDLYLDIVQILWKEFQATFAGRMEFYIAGYGEIAPAVQERVSDLAKAGVPIVFIGRAEPKLVFKDTLAVFSLQDETNYPSRVVAEALLMGCYTFIRNTGDSSCFGDGPGIIYLSEELNAQEVREKFSCIVDSYLKNTLHSECISAAAISRFGTDEVPEYFRKLLHSE